MARWRRGLVGLAVVVATAMGAFAAQAEDFYPTLSNPKAWNPATWYRPGMSSVSEMQLVVVRSNAAGCEPNCPEWISAEGAIAAGTPKQLKRVLKTLGRRKLPIIVNSPGGNVDAALDLGRIIRKNKLDIAIGKTEFSGCWPGMDDCRANDGKGAAYLGIASDDAAMCNSACPLMFAGGIRRVAGGWTYLGVHQITTTYRRDQVYYRTTYRIVHGRKKVIGSKVISRTEGDSYKTYEMSKMLERKLSAYLKEMGVGQAVLDRMKATPASDISQVSLHDMLTMKLATSTDTVELFTSASLCVLDKLAANCREIPANKPTGGQTVTAKPAEVAAIEAKAEPSQPARMRLSLPTTEATGDEGSSRSPESSLTLMACEDTDGKLRVAATNPNLGETCGGPGGIGPWPGLGGVNGPFTSSDMKP